LRPCAYWNILLAEAEAETIYAVATGFSVFRTAPSAQGLQAVALGLSAFR
jgi:hypothetical protein